MTTQIYSRDELRAMPVEARKSFLKQQIQPFVQQVVGAARNGKTSIMLDVVFGRNGINSSMHAQLFSSIGQAPPSIDEIREALLEVFPDSTIAYEEKWIQTSPGKQEMKKGLTVDW